VRGAEAIGWGVDPGGGAGWGAQDQRAIQPTFGGFGILEPGPSMLIDIAADLGDRMRIVFAGSKNERGQPNEEAIASGAPSEGGIFHGIDRCLGEVEPGRVPAAVRPRRHGPAEQRAAGRDTCEDPVHVHAATAIRTLLWLAPDPVLPRVSNAISEPERQPLPGG